MIAVTFFIPNDSPVTETWPDWTDEARVKEHARMLGAVCYTTAEVPYVDDLGRDVQSGVPLRVPGVLPVSDR